MRLTITGPDATQALAELISHAQYDRLDVTIAIEEEDYRIFAPLVDRQIKRAQVLDRIKTTYPSLKGGQ